MNSEFQNLNLMKSSDEVHLEEGLLSVDIYVKDGELVIVAPIAGSSKENIEVIIQGDILIIKGERFPQKMLKKHLIKRRNAIGVHFQDQLFFQEMLINLILEHFMKMVF
jgi:HSP20 family molecular chaperone IbpA